MDDLLKKIKAQVVSAVDRQLAARSYRLFFFGSRVRGTARPNSNVDIGLEADQPLPLAVTAQIEAELEDNLPVLQKIELVDFKSASGGFYREALKSAELIYER